MTPDEILSKRTIVQKKVGLVIRIPKSLGNWAMPHVPYMRLVLNVDRNPHQLSLIVLNVVIIRQLSNKVCKL